MMQIRSNCGSPFHQRGFHLSSRAMHRGFPRVDLLVGLILFTGSIVGCIATPTPAKDISPTALENCFPTSVFTAEDMQARVDCHPNDYRLQLSKDTVVLFAFPSPTIDWTGPVFVIHVPSVSQAIVDYDGSLFMTDYQTPEGQVAIETVLNNPALMARILERAREIQNGPAPPFIFR